MTSAINYGKRTMATKNQLLLRKYRSILKRLKNGSSKGNPTIAKTTGGGWIWQVYGIDGTRQYMGYTKDEARSLYHEEIMDKLENLVILMSND